MLSAFQKLKDTLKKTREKFFGKLAKLFKNKRKIDDELLDDIEEILISADVGVSTTFRIMDSLKEKVKSEKANEVADVQRFLQEEILSILQENEVKPFPLEKIEKPFVILIIGVNGVGKTTSIGKLAKRFQDEGKKVLLSASDTFRAAAIEQLNIWAERANVEIVKHQDGADPASVAYDALSAAKAREVDILIVDTAGRLHTKKNLMQELAKIKRVLQKLRPDAPNETILVLDATTGQNAIAQAKSFDEIIGINSIILAKLDGTAKGGVILAIKDELDIPVRLIGIGEKLDDLRDFNPEEYVRALFSE